MSCNATSAAVLTLPTHLRSLYRVRLSTSLVGGSASDGSFVSASIPARCWVAAGLATPLTLYLTGESHVGGVSLDLPCAPGPVPASLAGGALSPPDAVPVRIELPRAAETLTMPLPDAQQAQAAAAAAEAAQRRAAGEDEGGTGGEGGEASERRRAPPKDERSWLQKNWMVLLGVAMVVSRGTGLWTSEA